MKKKYKIEKYFSKMDDNFLKVILVFALAKTSIYIDSCFCQGKNNIRYFVFVFALPKANIDIFDSFLYYRNKGPIHSV